MSRRVAPFFDAGRRSSLSGHFNRRDVLTGLTAAGLSPAATALLPVFDSQAARLSYELSPTKVRDGVWMIAGKQEAITRENGGAIANIGIVDTTEGAVVIDTGSSKAFGEALVRLARDLTGKPVVRAYLTHFHPDHVFGNQAFANGVVAAPEPLISGLAAMGEDFSSAMYYIAGDWMRGTEVIIPKTVVSDGVEEIGGHTFRTRVLSGHTDCDLVVTDETTGIVFAGDLIFLDRAPTTPHAELNVWRSSLAEFDKMFDRSALVVPGHGPVKEVAVGREQTERWLNDIEAKIRDCFERGLSATEAIAEPLPRWTQSIALARYEYERSVLHIYPQLEAGTWPRVDTSID
ncbi:MAG: quinoprotein relay system zinc metallohydrolase 1 [Pseudomonadota bacterium]